MKTFLDRYGMNAIPRDGANDGGAGGGGGGNAGGAGNAGGNNGGGGGSAGSSAGAGTGYSGPWHRNPSHGFDNDTIAWIEERKFDNLGQAMKAGRDSAIFARDRNVLPKPVKGKEADWEGWSEFGWTTDATKYQLAKPTLKDGEAFDQAAFDVITKSAHANKVPPQMASALFADLQAHNNKLLGEFKAAQAGEAQRLTDALKAEWGTNYDTNKALAEKAFRYFAPDSVTAAQVETAMGSAGLVKMFHTIGAAMGEDSLVTNRSAGGAGFGAQSLAQVQGELDKLQRSEEFLKISKNPRDPRYSEMMDRRQALINKKAALQAA